ncbi:zinc finger FYVE domain-containing protein 21 [Trichonephila clavata]|uniref:Zinc finger FYVE domain-containing protein 21 n=1 Tax=Trichonephila clavata TaxID=2740835 RepID=A0A8X6HGX4_TRICU|nr:zinc finger FYVE domain-containing protein 21 [Trichonephila clavata]
MSYENLDCKKRLVKSRSGLKIVRLDDEPTSPFEMKEPFWVPDGESPSCARCQAKFDFLTRRHHCRRCGNVFCSHCCENKIPLPRMSFVDPVRVCIDCVEVTKKENEFYDKHLKVLTSGANYNLDEENGSGTYIPLFCCLSKDHQAIMFDGGNMWQHSPVHLEDIVSVRILGSTGSGGTTHISGAVIRFLDFKKDEKEIRICLADIPNRKQSAAWVHALQKSLKYVVTGSSSP